nr:hypothetical protein CFP56_33715 [Quercus suber]
MVAMSVVSWPWARQELGIELKRKLKTAEVAWRRRWADDGRPVTSPLLRVQSSDGIPTRARARKDGEDAVGCAIRSDGSLARTEINRKDTVSGHEEEEEELEEEEEEEAAGTRSLR